MKPFGQRLHEDSPTRLAYLCAAVPVRCPPGTYTSSPASISRTSWNSNIASVLTVLAEGTDLSPRVSGTTGVPRAFYCDHLRLGFTATVHGVSATGKLQLFGPAGPSRSSKYIGVPIVSKRNHQRSSAAVSFRDVSQRSHASHFTGRSRPFEQRGPTQRRPI